MHPQAIAGFLSAWAVAYVAIGGYCVSTYRIRGRELEYVLFGVLALALAVTNAGYAWSYVATDARSLEEALIVAMAGRIAATALLLHFVLAFTRSPPSRRVAGALYASMVLFEALNAADLLFVYEHAREHPVRVLGAVLTEVAVPPQPGAIAFALVSVVTVVFAAAAVGRAFIQRNVDRLTSLIGIALLTIAVLHDALRTASVIHGPTLAPHGYAAFMIGVMLTLVARYTSLRRQLQASTVALESSRLSLEHRSNELTRSYEDLRAAQSELVRKEQLAAVGELSAVIAHEVRNPLAIITNAVASLRRGELAAEDRATLLSILDEESSRLNRLVGDLLQYARPVTLDRQHVSVREIVERALGLARGRTDISIELDERGPLERIWADPNLLRQVVENLVTNALQAMSSGGTLTVRLSPHTSDGAPGVELQIQDTGEGMNTTVRTRALDPFFTTRPSGTGLGLAIVARFVDAHGGRLQIRSAAGAGAVLQVFLPVASEGAASTWRSRSSEEGRRASEPAPTPKAVRKSAGGPEQ